MTLREPTQGERLEDLDTQEEQMLRAVSRATRRWLLRVQRAVLPAVRTGAQPTTIVAAASPAQQPEGERLPVTLGDLTLWWREEVDTEIASTVREVWLHAYLSTREGVVQESSMATLGNYVSGVSDRLVRGLEPPLPDAAMDAIRISLTQSVGEGWSTQQLAQDIAARLSWEKEGAYWRSEYDRYTEQIDGILDQFGPPGNPAREAARENDPEVRRLQQARSQARLQLDREQSYWDTRATRIARTESTGAYNAATISAYVDENVQFKQWVATNDARTREDHRAADGQIVPVDQPFIVGGSALMFPGEAGGPAGEVVNCRCTTIGVQPEDVPADVLRSVSRAA